MQYFDTHAHYDDGAFDPDRETLLASLPEQGAALVVNPGCDGKSSLAAAELAARYPHVYAAVGWHPHEADSFDEAGETLLRSLAARDKVVAIGEIGLDYHYDFSPREQQMRVFRRQMELAEELDLPVVIHDREAHGDCMEVVRAFPRVRGAFHCYSGSPEMAAELVERGWYLGFTGAITFKNARRALETLRAMPAERILAETDCPYLAPVPHRGKRNDSRLLPRILEVIGECRGISPEAAAALTLENGRRFFGI